MILLSRIVATHRSYSKQLPDANAFGVAVVATGSTEEKPKHTLPFELYQAEGIALQNNQQCNKAIQCFTKVINVKSYYAHRIYAFSLYIL